MSINEKVAASMRLRR